MVDEVVQGEYVRSTRNDEESFMHLTFSVVV